MITALELRRLRAAAATGNMPGELWPVVLELARRVESPTADVDTPAERLQLAVSAEVDRWMRRRGLTTRTVGVQRRTLQRCLKGGNVKLASIADVADAMNCDVAIEFLPRSTTVGGATTTVSGATPFQCSERPSKMTS